MKKTILLLLIFIQIAVQQSIAQSTLNTSGATLHDDTVSYAYSVGEVSGFSVQPLCSYTQGVIQPARFLCAPVKYEYSDQYEIAVYPNPANNVLIIETDYPDFKTYRIIASNGRLAQTGKFTYSPINISILSKGFYLLEFFSSDNTVKKTFKFLKN